MKLGNMFGNNSSLRYETKKIVAENPESGHNRQQRLYRPNTSILEFGPATGNMTKYFAEELHCAVSIVELDKQCFEIAKQYAVDGFCGNIEDMKWAEYYKGQKFDYISFSSVLEHLTDPLLALSASLNFLKEEGSIIVSIPNTAHNSVILELMQGEFTYQDTGLLDKTHLRFFTYKTALNLFKQAGLAPVSYDATYVETGKNEFSVKYQDVPQNIGRFLKERLFGEVYTFIFELKKITYLEEHQIPVKDKIGGLGELLSIDVNLLPEKIRGEVKKLEDNLMIQKIMENPEQYLVLNSEIQRMSTEITEIYNDIPNLENYEQLKKRNDEIAAWAHAQDTEIEHLRNVIQQKDLEISQLQKNKKAKKLW